MVVLSAEANFDPEFDKNNENDNVYINNSYKLNNSSNNNKNSNNKSITNNNMQNSYFASASADKFKLSNLNYS